MQAVILHVNVCGYNAKEILYSVWKGTAKKNVDLQVVQTI
jgi:hypothetical protein